MIIDTGKKVERSRPYILQSQIFSEAETIVYHEIDFKLELKLYRVKLKLSGKIGFIGKKSFDQNIFAAAMDSHMQMNCQ